MPVWHATLPPPSPLGFDLGERWKDLAASQATEWGVLPSPPSPGPVGATKFHKK